MRTLIALCLILSPSFLLADDRSEDRFSLEMGVFVEAFETTVRLDSEMLGRGTVINFEDDLGLKKDQSNFRLDGTYRIARKHRIEFGYTSWSRKNTRILDTEIQFGDEIYPVDAEILTSSGTDVYKLAYKYSFVNSDRYEAGISGGFSVFDFDASLDVIAGGGGASFESEEVVAPVPLLGGFFDWKIGENFVLRTTGEVFDLSTGGLDGHLSDVKGTLNWYPFRNVGFGAGYNRVGLRYLDDGDAEVEVKYVYSGVLAYAIFSF